LTKFQKPEKKEQVSMGRQGGEDEKAADTHSAMRAGRLNGSDTLKHCGVISLRALGGLHLKSSGSAYIFIGCKIQEKSCRTCGGK
jgi:hypothetical protein